VSVSASPVRDSSGKTKSAVAVVLDITERKQAEAALRDAKALLETRVEERTAELSVANEELQNEISLRKRLEGEVLEIVDREQRRLGQDLHDSLCQHLAATAFMARALAERLKSAREIAPAEIDKIAELINKGVTEARTIARGLHPVEMDSAGLQTALRTLVSEHQDRTAQCRLELDEEILIPDPTVALHLYRIAREAVINADKHARASEIVVTMEKSRAGIELSVRDDGIGIGQTNNSAGMGFHIMDYRARSIGARLQIEPNRPRGTRVSCYLPRK
jgi:signal transduction histidine kinase